MKNQKVEEAYNTLRQGVVELIQNPSLLEETMKTYGDNVEFNHYSGFNTLLLMFDTMARKGKMFNMARGYRQWEKQFNRKVKKGEKAMYILAPIIVKHKEIDPLTEEEIEHSELKGFKAVPVFELCQTEGEPIPQVTKDKDYKSLNELHIKDFIEKVNVPVEFEDMIHVNGYTNGKRIAIATHNGEVAQICTLFHELAHMHLHYKDGKEESVPLKELEAEAVAYMVSSALGIENAYSKAYISQWNKENEDIDEVFVSRCDKLVTEAIRQIDLFKDCVVVEE